MHLPVQFLQEVFANVAKQVKVADNMVYECKNQIKCTDYTSSHIVDTTKRGAKKLFYLLEGCLQTGCVFTLYLLAIQNKTAYAIQTG
ncbi:MAG: hypothetical protein WC865_10805 [Bacteroidales bacterium]